MKPNHTIVVLSFYCLIFTCSCTDLEDKSQKKNPSTTKQYNCEDLYAEEIPGQMIVHIDPSCHDMDDSKTCIDSIALDFKNNLHRLLPRYLDNNANTTYPIRQYLQIRECGCGPGIFQISVDPEIDLNGFVSEAEEDLGPRGDYVSFTRNKKLRLIFDNDNKEYCLLDDEKINQPTKGVKVAIIDSGIKGMNSADLNSKLWINTHESNGLPSFDDENNCYTDDINGYNFNNNLSYSIHGAMVAKIASEGIPSDKVSLMDLRIFDGEGNATLFDAMCATKYAIDNGARIINNSWGYYNPSEKVDSAYLHLLEEAASKNILIIAAAGNNGLNTDKCKHYPSGFSDPRFSLGIIISTSFLNSSKDALNSESNYGKSTCTIAANGIHSLLLNGNSYNIEGSSFATPVVTNYAVTQINNKLSLSVNELVDCITNNANDLDLELKSEGALDTTVPCP